MKNYNYQINTSQSITDPRFRLAAENNKQKIIERAKGVILQLKETAKSLSKKDIASWRTAHQMALNIENPKRIELYNIYDFTTTLDTHYIGVKNRILMGVLAKKFRLVDAESNEDREITKILQATWFKQFLKLAIDSFFYGHSLIEFGDVLSNPFISFSHVRLVPRRHVCPEYGVILTEQSDEPAKKGISYRQGGIANWVVEVGEDKDLGLLLPITPHVISKKHAQIFWDGFAEKFGIPIIYANSDTRNDSELLKIENMLDQMGSAAWGLFPSDTTLKLVETSSGDAWMVFDKRIERSNSEISKCLGGQTMAFDNGSSLSQAKVHQEGFDEVIDYYAEQIEDIINSKLIPFLLLHGFPFDGLTFEYDDTYEYTPQEMKSVEEMLLQYYEIDPQHFIDKYKIQIIGAKSQTQDPLNPEKKKI